jgi:hypothetical protein
VARAISYLCTIVGAVGAVACLLVIPAIWAARGSGMQEIANLSSAVRDPLETVQSRSAEFQRRVESARGAMDQGVEQAGGAEPGSIEAQLAGGLLEVLDQTIGPVYARLRDAYVALRERVAAANEVAAAVQRLVPALTLPSLPTDELAAIDSQLQDMDAALRSMRSDVAAGRLPGAVLQAGTTRIEDAVRAVDARLDSLVTAADNVSARAQQMEARVEQAQASAERTMTIAAIVLSLICVYVGLLHVALFLYGRSMRVTWPAYHGPHARAADPRLRNASRV